MKKKIKNEKKVLKIGTAQKNGSHWNIGLLIKEAVKNSDFNLIVKLKETKGSDDNIELIKRGKLDICLVQGDLYRQKQKEKQIPPNIKEIIFPYPKEIFKLFSRDIEINTIRDLGDKIIAVPKIGQGTHHLLMSLLAQLEIEPKVFS